MKNVKYRIQSLLVGLTSVVLGIVFFANPAGASQGMLVIAAVVSGVSALINIGLMIYAAARRDKPGGYIVRAAFDTVIFVLIMLIEPRNLAFLVPLLMSVWIIGTGVIKLVVGFMFWRYGVSCWWITVLTGGLFLLGGAAVVVDSALQIVAVQVVFGVYLVTSGVAGILEFFSVGRMITHGGAPGILGRAMAPKSVLRVIDSLPEYEQTGKNPEAYCEVFVHLCDSPDSVFGHVDIAVSGKTYSFGCYNSASTRLGGILSDGVLVRADRESYIKHQLEVEKKILLAYEIMLTDSELDKLVAFFVNFMTNSDIWLPPVCVETGQCRRKWGKPIFDFKKFTSSGSSGKSGSPEAAPAPSGEPDDNGANTARRPEEFDDAASKLYLDTGCSFFKSRRNVFREYFAIGTNCVRLVDEALNSTGKPGLRVTGVLTPGDYLNYLEKSMARRRGIVYARKIYASRNEVSFDVRSFENSPE